MDVAISPDPPSRAVASETERVTETETWRACCPSCGTWTETFTDRDAAIEAARTCTHQGATP